MYIESKPDSVSSMPVSSIEIEPSGATNVLHLLSLLGKVLGQVNNISL
jgi:hypothetical protein